MERITNKMLNGKVDLLNKLLGQSTESYSKKANGEWAPNPRVFYIGAAYGGYRLERMCNSGSGASDISPRGTKREVYDYVSAFIQGVEELS
jgi:hypothetical protein